MSQILWSCVLTSDRDHQQSTRKGRNMIQTAAADESAEHVSDEALVAAAREQPADFGLLYERYRQAVYRYLMLRVGTREDAADLTQLVFLRAFRSLAAFKAKRAPFSAWLFRIARNAATDSLRRKRPTIYWSGLTEALTAGIEGPEHAAEQRERLDLLRREFERLSQDKRELLILRFATELTVREIAQVIGKSEAAVRKQLSRIIDALKEHYDDELQ